MATTVLGALKSTFTTTNDGNNKHHPHSSFIEQKLLPIIYKLQKEIGWGRKFKECHAPLQEAVLALKAFQQEEWTPGCTSPKSAAGDHHHTATTAATTTTATVPTTTDETTTNNNDNNGEETAAEVAVTTTQQQGEEEGGDESTIHTQDTPVTAVSSVGDDDSSSPSSHANKPQQPTTIVDNNCVPEGRISDTDSRYGITAATILANKATTAAVDEEEDDPQTRENVPPAIKITIQSLILVLQKGCSNNNSRQQPKACEYALEGISVIVEYRYLSGRAGGGGGVGSKSSGGASSASPSSNQSTSGANDGNNNNNPQQQQQQQQQQITSILHQVLETVAKCSDSNHEGVQTALITCLSNIVTSPKCSVHENSMLTCLRSTFHVYLVTKSSMCKGSAKAALVSMLKAVLFRMEAHEAVLNDSSNHSTPDHEQKDDDDNKRQKGGFASQYHADAYYLFRSLCKLSSKELPADNLDESQSKQAKFFNNLIPTDPTELNSKILSLELILVGMEYCGNAFMTPKFLYLLQNYLCVSLLKNCVSNHTQVAFLSQKIFLVLVSKFKSHLKQDIEVFMSNVFFRVLESQNSSFKQKALVLESLRSLCKDPNLLTQIFLNYDCDFDAMNLYKDIIVHMLTKLGGKFTSSSSTMSNKRTSTVDQEQDFELSLASIECLVTILQAFLRALGLPAGDETESDSAGARIRTMLNLDSALATGSVSNEYGGATKSEADSVVSDDISAVFVQQHQPTTNTSAAGTTPTYSNVVAEQIVDAFDRKRNAEQNFEIGAVKFTLSLKTGLHFFIDNGFVERDAKQIALFFLANKDKLDKTQIGEALGREPDAAFVKNIEDAEAGGPGFWVRILHHYVDALDLNALVFDEAIRLFLSGFRLPGEAQKIDRIMEKFAERFASQNPTIFPSSDTAFILAFSVIMLQTDLHNPSLKPEKKMTVESFLINNSGIGENQSDLPEEFLRGIYGRIKERPFSLKEDDAARERAGAQKQIFDTSLFFERGSSSFFGTSTEERKRENFKKERDEMMAATEQLIRRRPEKSNKGSSHGKEANLTDHILPADVVKPMFDVTWGPMIAILSQVLECADDERSVAVCLNGFVYAIRLAAHGRMSLARDTFVSSLAKFTFLGSLKEMKRKNVESIRTLLSVAVIDGEYLGESWAPVLQCISQLARLRLTASGLDSDESFLLVDSPRRSTEDRPEAKTPPGFFTAQSSRELAREAEESNGKAVLEAVQEVLIDKVFSSTVSLSAKSLAHFVEQLIAVAKSEVSGTSKSGISGVDTSKHGPSKTASSSSGPSIFSLQRLVDVADYNMDIRPRLVWAQVWELMAEFLVELACHENRMVSVFAIDSLKQLSLKFLEKPELSEFNFQCSFLRPFLVVMENKNSREDIRELILQCVDTIIRTKSHNLRSGWKIVFSILTVAAADRSEKIEYLGLATLQTLLDDHLDDIGSMAARSLVEAEPEELNSLDKRNRNANADDFICLCKASLSYVQFEESDSLRPFGLTMRALCHMAIYADLLAEQRILPPVAGIQSSDPNGQGYTYDGLSEQESLALALWRPLFEGLAEGVRSTAKTSASGIGCLVQRGSILALRAILLRHGHLFSTPQLAAILSETVLPAIRAAAENETSHVVGITSDSPSVSDIDFLVDPMPLPPDPDDPELQQFAAVNTAPKRPVGPAELMLEASFTDLRHGGDGDLRKAHVLAKKSASDEMKVTEQPFPDSWLATTAPLALGFLTDLVSEFVVYREQEGRDTLWPLFVEQYRSWCVGESGVWTPCEALVRVACRELYRLPRRMFDDTGFSYLSTTEQMAWSSALLNLYSEILMESVDAQDAVRKNLAEAKEQASLDRRELDEDTLESSGTETPYGKGRLVQRTRNVHFGSIVVAMNVIQLDFGGTLYQPAEEESPDSGIPSEVNVPDAYWVQAVPAIKIRCIMAYCLQQSLVPMLDSLVPLAERSDLELLLSSLNDSRACSEKCAKNEDVSMAFQEALLKDWGDGIRMPDEATEATARLSLLHGSAVFFLSQEAGATKSLLRLLSALYHSNKEPLDESKTWDKVEFSEPQLITLMMDVLDKFLTSEGVDGHLVDPNVWHNAVTEQAGGTKVALYCTSFASVVADTLSVILATTRDQFDRHKQEFFPRVCALIRVQSDDIRELVQDIVAKHVAPYLGIHLGIAMSV